MENEDTEREKNESLSAVKKDGNNKMSQYENRPFRRNTIIVPDGPFFLLNVFVRIEFKSNLSDTCISMQFTLHRGVLQVKVEALKIFSMTDDPLV